MLYAMLESLTVFAGASSRNCVPWAWRIQGAAEPGICFHIDLGLCGEGCGLWTQAETAGQFFLKCCIQVCMCFPKLVLLT